MEQMPPDGRFDPAAAIRDIPLLLMDYWQLMKLKCMQILLVFKVAFNVGYAFFTSAMIFFIQYRLGFGSLATSAIVAWFGAYLKGAGFDAALATQPQTAMVALDRLFILMPGICFAIGCAVIFFYPLNKKRFGSLQSALHLKRQGKEYSQYQADLDRIL